MKKEFEKLNLLKNLLDEICVGTLTTWKDRILLESIWDEQYQKFVLNIFETIKRGLASSQLNDLFYQIRAEAEPFVKSYDENDSVINKYDKLLKVERYFGIIEQLTEMSIVSENLYKSLLNKYGFAYMQKIDSDNLSRFTNKIIEKYKHYDDDEINKYLVLKFWQDEQNVYAKKVFDIQFKMDEIEREFYEKYLKEMTDKLTLRKKFELIKILDKPYLHIDLLSRYYAVGMLDDFKKYIGGKGYGLAILNCYARIPKTWIITYKSPKGNLNFLRENQLYAVRSSADCEDGSKHSFAGIFDSFLAVKSCEVCSAIEKVFDSVNSSKAKHYLHTINLEKPNMNVIIQEFIDSERAGVWLGESIDSGIYEVVDGLGENLVSGKAVPRTHNFDENDFLCSFFVKLQTSIGSKCDFEFCEKSGDLYMLQCRPVTTTVKNKIIKQDGIGVSSGIVEGDILYLESPDDMSCFQPDKILVTYATDPNWLPILLKSKGIVTSFGGYLCHTAIIARELQIPCVVGVDKNLFEKIIHSKKIRINGDNGKIEILE